MNQYFRDRYPNVDPQILDMAMRLYSIAIKVVPEHLYTRAWRCCVIIALADKAAREVFEAHPISIEPTKNDVVRGENNLG